MKMKYIILIPTFLHQNIYNWRGVPAGGIPTKRRQKKRKDLKMNNIAMHRNLSGTPRRVPAMDTPTQKLKKCNSNTFGQTFQVY